jgi:hypothetical protein
MDEKKNNVTSISGERIPTPGAEFFDNRYSPVKFVTTLDIPEKGITSKSGDVVFVAGASKVYGPYRLDLEIGRGNGKVHWKAYALESKAQMSKPKTKAEVEQENAQLLARLAKLEAAAKLAPEDVQEAK